MTALKARIVTDLDRVTFARVDIVKAAAVARGVDAGEIEDGDDRLWILGQRILVEIIGVDTVLVAVPQGFVTDGASVPRAAQILTRWFPWDVPQRWGAIVHDWCYSSNGTVTGPESGYRGPFPVVGKAWADSAFRATLEAAGASRLRAAVMYWAVRLFGGHAYRADQKTGPTIRV